VQPEPPQPPKNTCARGQLPASYQPILSGRIDATKITKHVQRTAAWPPRSSSPAKNAHTWHRCNWQEAPKLAGTYAIFRGSVLVYIGSAIDVRLRLQHHGLAVRWQQPHTKFGPFCELRLRVAINRRRFEHATRELRLINKLSPPANRTHA
jgi:hypothetical protein